MLTKAKIAALINKWKKKLRLQNWDIKFVLVDAEGLNGCAGTLEWQTEYHSATMHLARELERPDMEETIIHELLHLLLEGHKNPVHRDVPLYESGLNTLSSLLIKK